MCPLPTTTFELSENSQPTQPVAELSLCSLPSSYNLPINIFLIIASSAVDTSTVGNKHIDNELCSGHGPADGGAWKRRQA
jgi:hypothetical protein